MNRKLYLGVNGLAFDTKGKLWVYSNVYNEIYTYDFCKNMFEFEHRFVDKFVDNRYAFGQMECFDNKLLFVPYIQNNKILVYDFLRKKENTYKVPCNKFSSFQNFIVDNILFLISNNNELFTYDVNKNIFLENQDILSKKILNVVQGNDIFLFSKNNEIVLIVNATKKIAFIINTVSGDETQIILDNIPDDISYVKCLDDSIWIILKNSFDVYEYNFVNNITKKYNSLEQKYLPGKNQLPYYSIEKANNRIFVLNYYASDLKEIDLVDNIIKSVNIHDELDNNVRMDMPFGPLYKKILSYNNKYYYIPERGIGLLSLDSKDNILKVINIIEDKNNIRLEGMKSVIERNLVVYESDVYQKGLKDFIDVLLEL